MAENAKIEILGLDEIVKHLDGLPDHLEANTLRAANRAALKIVLEDARTSAPSFLHRSIKISNIRRTATGVKLKITHPMAHWYEWGTDPRETFDGQQRGVFPRWTQSFVEAPATRKENEVIQWLENHLAEFITEYWVKLEQRQSKKLMKFK